MRLRKTAEIVIGVLYAIGAVHQAFFVLPESREFYVAMAAQAWIRPAQILVEEALVPNSAAVTVLVVALEATLAIAILSRGAAVRWALVAGGAFSIVGALTGSPAETIGFGLLAAVHFWLARARWDTSVRAKPDS